MSSTAPAKSHVLFPPAMVADYQPTDTYLAQTLANNASHMADQAGQVRVAWVTDTAVGGNFRQPSLVADAPSLSVWERVATFGPFPVRRVAGNAYRLRARVAGFVGVSGNADFRVVWSAPGAARADLLTVGGNTFEVTGVVATTPAWLGDAVLELSRADIYAASSRLSTRLTLASAEGTSVNMTLTTLEVWVRNNSGASVAEVSGLYAAEYFGDGLPT